MFLQAVTGTAAAGDVKEVSPGYARNYLLPRKLAIVADTHVVEQVRQKDEATRRRLEKQLKEAQEVDSRLRRVTVTIHARVGEGGRLFGAVTSAEIAQQLKRETGIAIDKKKIDVEPAIKSLGPHEVTVKMHPEVVSTIRVVVAAQ